MASPTGVQWQPRQCVCVARDKRERIPAPQGWENVNIPKLGSLSLARLAREQLYLDTTWIRKGLKSVATSK